MKIDEDFLPVGTVVKLRLEDRMFMIVGYFGQNKTTKEIYDYLGVYYPFGFEGEEKLLTFNRDFVKEVLHMGHIDDRFENLKKGLFEKIDKSEGE